MNKIYVSFDWFLEWLINATHIRKNYQYWTTTGRAISPNVCTLTFGPPCMIWLIIHVCSETKVMYSLRSRDGTICDIITIVQSYLPESLVFYYCSLANIRGLQAKCGSLTGVHLLAESWSLIDLAYSSSTQSLKFLKNSSICIHTHAYLMLWSKKQCLVNEMILIGKFLKIQ